MIKYLYRAFGLTIESAIEFPELLPVDAGSHSRPDVAIRYGDVPAALENPKKIGLRYQVKPGHFLLDVDDIARYHAVDGSLVHVHPYDGAKASEVRTFLLGSVFGILILQRRLLPLHASGINVNGQCVLFCGASGSGKSTIAHAFVKRGYKVLADDICVISLDPQKDTYAAPAFPAFKLWEDTLLQLGEEPASYNRPRHILPKYRVPVPEHFHGTALPVKKIYFLAPHNKPGINITPLTGMHKFNTFRNQTYKRRYIKFLGTEKDYFKDAAAVAAKIPIDKVNRPIRPFMLTELTNALENDFLK